MSQTAERDETLFRLADGLFPIRLEPGHPLLIGREGSPLRIELRTREKQGMDALLVYDPSGARLAPSAVIHALSPLASLVGESFPPPSDAPPNAVAFRFAIRPPAADAASSSAHAPAPGGLEGWLDVRRLEGMLWAGLEDAREGAKNVRDLVMAVFDGSNSPGLALLTATQLARGLPPAEAARQARTTVNMAVNQGGRLVFQVVDTLEQLRKVMDEGGLLATHGALLDAALATWPAPGDVPEGHVRAAVFEEAAVRPQLVAVRSPGERAEEAREEEQEAILQGPRPRRRRRARAVPGAPGERQRRAQPRHLDRGARGR